MNWAAEARFRVQAPNAGPRTIKAIALDAAGEAVLRRLAGAGWTHATFLTTAARAASGDRGDPSLGPASDALSDLEGNRRSVADEVDTADLVVLVPAPRGAAHPAAIIAAACSRPRVITPGRLFGVPPPPDHPLSTPLP